MSGDTKRNGLLHDLEPQEITALATLHNSIEWPVVETVVKRQVGRIESQLAETSFTDLSQVTALQGERRSLLWLLKLVERAHEHNTKE